MVRQQIARFGKKLVDRGLVEAHSGNISVRIGSTMLITGRGCALDEIDEDSVVEVDLDRPSNLDPIASAETPVHRKIYQNTSALSIIHAHPLFAIIESMLAKEGIIVPLDVEGQYYLQEIPIVRGGVGTPDLAEQAADALCDHNGVIVYGHGTFAAGRTLEEAYTSTTQIEHSCKLKYYFEAAKK